MAALCSSVGRARHLSARAHAPLQQHSSYAALPRCFAASECASACPFAAAQQLLPTPLCSTSVHARARPRGRVPQPALPCAAMLQGRAVSEQSRGVCASARHLSECARMPPAARLPPAARMFPAAESRSQCVVSAQARDIRASARACPLRQSPAASVRLGPPEMHQRPCAAMLLGRTAPQRLSALFRVLQPACASACAAHCLCTQFYCGSVRHATTGLPSSSERCAVARPTAAQCGMVATTELPSHSERCAVAWRLGVCWALEPVRRLLSADPRFRQPAAVA